MSLCSKCFNKKRCFDEYTGLTVMCMAWRQVFLPEPLMGYDVQKVVRSGKCNFYNQLTRIDENGYPQICTDEDAPTEEEPFKYYGGL